MKTLLALLAIGTLVASPTLVQAKITRTVEKSYTVKEGGLLRVRTHGGDIQVSSGDGTEVKVLAREVFATDSQDKADALQKELKLTIEQDGSGVSATAEYGTGGWHFGPTPVTVGFTVVVPKHYRVDLVTSGGDIGLESLSGQARLRTSGGNLRLARIDGDVDGETSGGNIQLIEGTGKVKLETSGGDIKVEKAGGEADLSTSGGNIYVDSVRGRVSASTSGGNVRANLDGPLTGDCSLTTSGGNVEVTVSKDAAFDLKAETSGGDVRAEGLSIANKGDSHRKRSLSGKVNGGGPKLTLGTSGGDVRIRAK